MQLNRTLIVAAVGVCGTSCFGQITSVEQERSVQTLATVSSGAEASDSRNAANFNPMLESITSTIAGAGGADATATAAQNSVLGSSSISGTFSAGGNVHTGSTFVVGESNGQSDFLYIFNLTTASEVRFHASGTLAYVGRDPNGEPSDLFGVAGVRLLNGVTEELIAGFTLFSEPGSDSADFAGTLPAGQYVILANAHLHAYSADLLGPPPRSGSGTANSTFTFAVVPPCRADFNGDGTVDFFDYLDFVDVFSSGAASADFNGDSVIDFFDYLDFVDAFSAGC